MAILIRMDVGAFLLTVTWPWQRRIYVLRANRKHGQWLVSSTTFCSKKGGACKRGRMKHVWCSAGSGLSCQIETCLRRSDVRNIRYPVCSVHPCLRCCHKYAQRFVVISCSVQPKPQKYRLPAKPRTPNPLALGGLIRESEHRATPRACQRIPTRIPGPSKNPNHRPIHTLCFGRTAMIFGT